MMKGNTHQIDERSSECINVSFRLPQQSILGLILFNLYVKDLYANDATIYALYKPSELHHCQAET